MPLHAPFQNTPIPLFSSFQMPEMHQTECQRNAHVSVEVKA